MLFNLGNLSSYLVAMLYALPGIVIGLSFHEFAHAWMADRLGDPTPRNQGRVTISPFAHIDPWGFLMLILFRFGYGRPVMYNPAYLKKRKRDEILIALAGIGMNLIIAFVSVFLYLLLYRFDVTNMVILNIIDTTAIININLIVFNILPIPPLDGYKVVRSLFLHKNINFFWKLDQYGFMILLILLATGILTPVLSFLTHAIISLFVSILGFIVP